MMMIDTAGNAQCGISSGVPVNDNNDDDDDDDKEEEDDDDDDGS